MMVAVPALRTVTTPLALTDASTESLEDQTTRWFDMTAPVALIGVATSYTVLPTSVGPVGAPLTWTVATTLAGSVTVLRVSLPQAASRATPRLVTKEQVRRHERARAPEVRDGEKPEMGT